MRWVIFGARGRRRALGLLDAGDEADNVRLAWREYGVYLLRRNADLQNVVLVQPLKAGVLKPASAIKRLEGCLRGLSREA
jgi:hypothetical protein